MIQEEVPNMCVLNATILVLISGKVLNNNHLLDANKRPLAHLPSHGSGVHEVKKKYSVIFANIYI
jgi:hypothetical protein